MGWVSCTSENLTKSEVIFITRILALLQKYFALKDGVLDPYYFDKERDKEQDKERARCPFHKTSKHQNITCLFK
ncbi:MAG: hypothetical protein F6K39_03850 [Okeania sp. SIO3B3]|nr:hypothetical protein [Okeania sp. SIO3B3]